MHPGFRSVSPRLTLILFVIALLTAAAPECTFAIPAPEIVIEDTLICGLYIASVYVDTSHFDVPTLFVGTWRDSNSVSYVLRATFDPLTVVDTVYRSQHIPNLLQTGFVNNDSAVDLLVGLASSYPDTILFSGLVALEGPSLLAHDTLHFPRGIRDVVVDDSSHELWVAYYHDTTYVYAPGTPDEGDTKQTLGAIVHYDSLTGTGTHIDNQVGGMDLCLKDVNGDGSSEVIAFWQSHSYFYLKCCGPVSPDWAYAGVNVYDRTAPMDTYDTLRAEGEEYGWGTDYSAVLSFHTPVPVADLTGDGQMEVVFSSAGESVNYGTVRRKVGVLSLVTRNWLWSIPEQSFAGYAHYAVSLWYLDDDSLLDVIVAIDYPSPEIRGYSGSTGELLFIDTTSRFIRPIDVGIVDNTGIRKGILRNHDTLFVIRLAEPVGVHDDPVTPEQFELYANYPNPFNASTAIEYALDAPGKVRLDIYNVLGRHVTTLVDDAQPAGRHRVTWNAASAPSGVYFYRLTVGDQVKTRKMVVLK